MNTNIAHIVTNTIEMGNGVYIGDKLLTAAHVITKSNDFTARSIIYQSNSAFSFNDTDYWYKKVLRILSLCKFGWDFDDFAIYKVDGSISPYTLSPDIPQISETLDTYSVKQEQEKTDKTNIFLNSTIYVTHVDKAKVLYIRGNYIFCEMDGMLEKGRSGCPLIKDNKVYGILRGGDDKKICWFQSSVSILKRLHELGISI